MQGRGGHARPVQQQQRQLTRSGNGHRTPQACLTEDPPCAPLSLAQHWASAHVAHPQRAARRRNDACPGHIPCWSCTVDFHARRALHINCAHRAQRPQAAAGSVLCGAATPHIPRQRPAAAAAPRWPCDRSSRRGRQPRGRQRRRGCPGCRREARQPCCCERSQGASLPSFPKRSRAARLT